MFNTFLNNVAVDALGTKAYVELNKRLGQKVPLCFMVWIFSDFIQGSHNAQNSQYLLSCVWIRYKKDAYGNSEWWY